MKSLLLVLFGALVSAAQSVSISPASYYATPPYFPFPGARLNDALSCGSAVGANQNASYIVAIFARGMPDSFSWRKDGGQFGTPVDITGGCQLLEGGVGIRFAHSTGHTAGDQWAINVAVSGTAAALSTNQPGYGALSRPVENKLRDLLLASDFAVDPSGQADSTAGLQNGIDQSRIRGQCLRLSGGTYKLSGLGLWLTNGQCIEAEGNSQVTLLMTANDMTAITIQGYNNKVSGFLITKSRGVTGGVGIMLNTSSSVDGGNTENNLIEDLYIVADDIVGNLLTAGVDIFATPAGEVVFTRMRNIHVQGARDGIWINSPQPVATHFQSNANWCTDCELDNSIRCLHITATGENHFAGLALNGCASDGTVKSAAIVIDSATETVGATTYHTGSYGNTIDWNIGEPANPVLVIDPYCQYNFFILPPVVYLSAVVVDNSGGKNSILSTGNFLPGYDASGNPQLWVGATSPHFFQQYATLQIAETGNNDILRIQRASLPGEIGPIGTAWLDFNPYANGFYLDGAPTYRGSTLKLDTRRTDAYVSGNIDFMYAGKPWANLKAVVLNNAYSATELHLSTVPASGGAPVDQGAIAARFHGREVLSLGSIANGSCASGTMALTGAAVGDSVAPAWPAAVFAAKVVGSMVVSAPNTVLISVCNFSGAAIGGNGSYGATVVR